jgi:TRAP-type mannitol/chloroaromatic compound transport system permease small subunit
MGLKMNMRAARACWAPLTFYEKFQHACILILSALIAIVIALAIWNLALRTLVSALSSTLDSADYAVFQAVFGTAIAFSSVPGRMLHRVQRGH